MLLSLTVCFLRRRQVEGVAVPTNVLTALRDAARETWQDFDVSQPVSQSVYDVMNRLSQFVCDLMSQPVR